MLRFLEAEHKQFAHAVEHEPALAEQYSALTTLFESRAGAIAEGIARAAKGEPEADEGGDEATDEATDA